MRNLNVPRSFHSWQPVKIQSNSFNSHFPTFSDPSIFKFLRIFHSQWKSWFNFQNIRKLNVSKINLIFETQEKSKAMCLLCCAKLQIVLVWWIRESIRLTCVPEFCKLRLYISKYEIFFVYHIIFFHIINIILEFECQTQGSFGYKKFRIFLRL